MTDLLKLKNPAGIRHSEDRWQGAAKDQPDQVYVKFTAPEFSVRTAARLMLRHEKDGCNTPATIVARYMGPDNRGLPQMVSFVADGLNVQKDEVIDVDLYEVMAPLVRTICLQLSGKAPRPGVLRQGLRLAGVADTPKASLLSKGVVSKGVAGGAGVLALAGQAAEPIKKATEGLEPFQGSPIIAQVTIGLLTIAGGAALAGIAADWIKHRKGL